jgi:hypothetical protein
MSKFVDFNDEKLPIGKRKQAYVKWAVNKGTSIESAKRQANKKFGFEMKEGLFAIVRDWSGRMQQRSFCESQIFDEYDIRKYKQAKWLEVWDDDEIEKHTKAYKAKGWDVVIVNLYS